LELFSPFPSWLFENSSLALQTEPFIPRGRVVREWADGRDRRRARDAQEGTNLVRRVTNLISPPNQMKGVPNRMSARCNTKEGIASRTKCVQSRLAIVSSPTNPLTYSLSLLI